MFRFWGYFCEDVECEDEEDADDDEDDDIFE